MATKALLLTSYIAWYCERCHRNGLIKHAANLDVFAASEPVMKAHNERSVTCDGDFFTIKILRDIVADVIKLLD